MCDFTSSVQELVDITGECDAVLFGGFVRDYIVRDYIKSGEPTSWKYVLNEPSMGKSNSEEPILRRYLNNFKFKFEGDSIVNDMDFWVKSTEDKKLLIKAIEEKFSVKFVGEKNYRFLREIGSRKTGVPGYEHETTQYCLESLSKGAIIGVDIIVSRIFPVNDSIVNCFGYKNGLDFYHLAWDWNEKLYTSSVAMSYIEKHEFPIYPALQAVVLRDCYFGEISPKFFDFWNRTKKFSDRGWKIVSQINWTYQGEMFESCIDRILGKEICVDTNSVIPLN